MRYTKYITTLFALIAISACTIADIDNQVTVGNTAKDDKIQVLGRITRFADVDVSTRGVKDQDEAKLTSMALAIFKVNAAGDGLDGSCVHYQYADDQAELLFTIERGSNYDYDTRYAMYVFCNMPGMQTETMGVGTSLSEMMAAYYNVEDIDIPANGFPMMGSLGDTFSTTFDKDGRVFILSPRENGDLTTPKVDGVTQTLLTIPMKAMYAKVNFTIEVDPDQTIDGNYSPQFTLYGYTVNNVPSKIDFNNGSNSDTDVLADSFSLPISGNTVASGANKINFTFYLPERYFEPATKSADYAYPFKKDGKIRGEDSVYMQRYKPELVGDKKATNVKITGRFRDHQSHNWDVDYTIYLGEDNYGDFNIKRNCEYHNYITIRGIQSSNDMSDEMDAISIDHRVNVERTQPAIISLRRETLLDSHFEVRPLRVRKSEEDATGINAVKVEVVNPGTTDWMRLERSFGDGTPAGSPNNESGQCIYINEDVNDAAYGKRRYFTYNLVKIPDNTTAGQYDHPLNNSTEVILPLTDATECCWIYIDECTEVGDAVRSGIVKVSYGKLEGTTFTPANNSSYPDVQYIINQRKLFQVTGTKTYNIEYQEEYLHNFDADDNFGQTEYEGMPWGLEDLQISDTDRAFYVQSKLDWDAITSWLSRNATQYKYDFYISAAESNVIDYEDADKDGDSDEKIFHPFSGYDFSKKIIAKGIASTKPGTDVSYVKPNRQLDEQPESAVEYCYNKNKRNSNGTVNETNLNWYLPAVDEIEDIVMSTYGSGLYTYARFIDFQSKYYWSSQPAYIQKSWTGYLWLIFFTTNYNGYAFIDNVKFARSTSVSHTGTTYAKVTSEMANTNISLDFGNLGSNNVTPTETTDTSKTPTYGAGYDARTQKNRVRCVRKQ